MIFMKFFLFWVVNAMSHIALFFWATKHKLAKRLTQFSDSSNQDIILVSLICCHSSILLMV